MSNFAIGTAQFGQPYGVANCTGQVTPPAAAAILRCAHENAIDTLDTAIAYGDSERCLGELGVSEWRVFTKLPPLPAGVADVSSWVETQVRASLRRLRLASLSGLLLHDSRDLLGARADEVVAALTHLKESGLVGLAGVSVYDPSELAKIWPRWRPDVVQAPCNALDRRLLRSGWLERLCADGVRVHVRSLFLQGLLLMGASERPGFFRPWQGVLDRWTRWCHEHQVSPLQAAVAFGVRLAGVERVVIGVDSPVQLREIFAACAVSVPSLPDDLSSEERDLVEPRRWRLA